MQNFEKLAKQFEAVGDLLTANGMDDGINAMVEDDSNVKRAGRIYKLVALGMKEAPDAMRTLAAIEMGKTEAEAEEMSEEEIAAPMMKAFNSVVIPFFAARLQQDGEK